MISQANSQAVEVLEVADDPRLSKQVKAFLKSLNRDSRDLVEKALKEG